MQSGVTCLGCQAAAAVSLPLPLQVRQLLDAADAALLQVGTVREDLQRCIPKAFTHSRGLAEPWSAGAEIRCGLQACSVCLFNLLNLLPILSPSRLPVPSSPWIPLLPPPLSPLPSPVFPPVSLLSAPPQLPPRCSVSSPHGRTAFLHSPPCFRTLLRSQPFPSMLPLHILPLFPHTVHVTTSPRCVPVSPRA